jgi:hypothetical protein
MKLRKLQFRQPSVSPVMIGTLTLSAPSWVTGLGGTVYTFPGSAEDGEGCCLVGD